MREDEVELFVGRLREGYALYSGLTDEEFEAAVFVTRPSGGAFGAF